MITIQMVKRSSISGGVIHRLVIADSVHEDSVIYLRLAKSSTDLADELRDVLFLKLLSTLQLKMHHASVYLVPEGKSGKVQASACTSFIGFGYFRSSMVC